MKVNRWAKVPFLEVSEKGSTGDADSPVDMSFLEGCRIIKAGYLNQKQLKDLDRTEGGFAIDYLRDNKVCRVVLGFTELGLWIEWKGEIGKFNPKRLVKPGRLVARKNTGSVEWNSWSKDSHRRPAVEARVFVCRQKVQRGSFFGLFRLEADGSESLSTFCFDSSGCTGDTLRYRPLGQ
jgi:hypothetical protein